MTECTIREFGPETCATLAMRGPYEQMPQAFATVYGWLAALGHTPRGMPVAVYLNDPATVAPGDALWELWAPIEPGAADTGPDDQRLAIRHVPAMTIATTIHKGPYDQVAPAYERLMTWITQQGLHPCGPPMEAYLNDPGETTPDEYLTEIMIPVGSYGLLDEALTIVGQQEGKKPQSVLERLGKRARVRLYERLVAGGVLRAEDDRILGIFPAHRWPSRDAAHEVAVRAGLGTALREGATAEARTGALISLLLALKAVDKAVDPASVGLSNDELNANAARIAEGDWAAKAVRQAIDSINAAILVVIFSTAVTGGGASN